MRTFDTEIIEQIKGKQVYEKLLVNGECLLDQFEAEIQGNPQYVSEFRTILAYMELKANGTPLPKKKFNEILGGKITTPRHEFKSEHLRIYTIQNANGRIIVMGGYKNSQPKDIRSFNSLVKEYTSTTR